MRGRSWRRGRALALGWLLASLIPSRAAAGLPRESPIYGPPFRGGLGAEVSVGLALCQPTLIYGGSCAGGPPPAGVALRVGLGWRINRHWWIAGAWVRQGHRPPGFVGGRADGGMATVRGILPLLTRGSRETHLDLGFELGLGWSQRRFERDAGPFQLASNGVLLRPALVFDGWVIADLALGFEIATHLNFHWQHCVDAECRTAPGAWVPAGLEGRWIDGLSLAVRATGLFFPNL